MPPRLNLSLACRACGNLVKPSSGPLAYPLVTFVTPPQVHQQQQRYASILSSLSDNPSAYHKKIRRGRGPASGKGKTSGRGHKGQKQHGKVPKGFQGGQTPAEVVHGSRGFHNPFTLDLARLNLDKVQQWIDQGRLDPSAPITIKEMNATRIVHGIRDGVKLLAKNSNELHTPINIVVSRASASAIAAVERAGGTVTTRYYTAPSIKRITSGLTDPLISLQTAPDSPFRALREQQAAEGTLPTFHYRLPDPASRKDLEYYRDPAHRGYLSYLVPKGDGPSLFVKTTARKFGPSKEAKQKEKEARQNRLW